METSPPATAIRWIVSSDLRTCSNRGSASRRALFSFFNSSASSIRLASSIFRSRSILPQNWDRDENSASESRSAERQKKRTYSRNRVAIDGPCDLPVSGSPLRFKNSRVA